MIAAWIFGITFILGQTISLVRADTTWSFLDVFAVAASALWLIRILGKPALLRAGRLFHPIIGFIGVSAVLLIIQLLMHPSDIARNWLYLARWASYAGIYLYISTLRTAIPWRVSLYVSGVALAVLGIIQLFLYPDLRNLMYLGWDPHYRRVFSTLFDPNFVGIIYVLTLLLGISYWYQGKANRWQVLVAEMIVFLALLGTYSRSSLIACFIGVTCYFGVKKQYTVLAVGVALLLVGILVLPAGMEGQNLLRSTSSAARLGTLSFGWGKFVASPLIGNGFIMRQSPEFSPLPSRAGAIDTSFLYILAALGIIGAVAYVHLWKHILSIGQSRQDPVLLSSIAAILAHSLFIQSLLYPWVMAWMWVLVAVVEKSVTAGRSRAV